MSAATWVRIEVQRFTEDERRTTVRYVDTTEVANLSDQDREAVEAIVAYADDLAAQLAERLDLTRDVARVLLIAELTERLADAEAYGREAARRGVLEL